jgi:type II secretory pathway component PulM
MKISLSKRERILIVGSLVAIILFVYMLLILPRFKAKIEDQEGRLSVLRSQLTSREKAAARLSELQEETGVLEAYLAANL